MPWRLIDKQDRGTLSEGRTKGLGTAFCKRRGATLATVCPITACKDFLNDVLWSEITGRPLTFHGLTTTKQDIFDPKGYIVLAILKHGAKNPKVYPEYEKDLADLAANHAHIARLLNDLEGRFGVTERTSIERLSDNRYLAIVPPLWLQSTHMISLCLLLMRVGMRWDGTGESSAYLKTYQGDDIYHLTAALPKVERMISEGVPKQAFDKPDGYYWHAEGIISLQWPVSPPKTKPLAESALKA